MCDRLNVLVVCKRLTSEEIPADFPSKSLGKCKCNYSSSTFESGGLQRSEAVCDDVPPGEL